MMTAMTRDATQHAEVRLDGRLTALEAPAVRAAIRDCAGRPLVIIDLRGVTAVDAAGLAALLDGRRMIEGEHPGSTLVLRVGAVVRRALQVSGTIGAFQIAERWAM
jgi:anti-anti-sigma factor